MEAQHADGGVAPAAERTGDMEQPLAARGTGDMEGDAWPAGSGRSALLKVGGLVVVWGVFVVDYFGSKSAGKSYCSAGRLGWLTVLMAAVVVAAIGGNVLARRSAQGRARLVGDVDWSNHIRSASAVLSRRLNTWMLFR